MKIGIVPYLNAAPFLGDGKTSNNSFDFVFNVPSKLSRLLETRAIDAGLIPVFDYLNGTGRAILPGLSISCKGPVESVRLFYQTPLKNVRKIYADNASSTSVALVRILLKEVYGIEPKIIKVPSDYLSEFRLHSLFRAKRRNLVPRNDKPSRSLRASAKQSQEDPHGILHIGNLAFRRIKGYMELDLGESWYKWTHLPFVFAFWVINDGKNAQGIRRFLIENLKWTRKNIDTISIQNARQLNLKKEFIKKYLTKSINYSLNKSHIKAIEKFQNLCLKHGILKTKRQIVFADEKNN